MERRAKRAAEGGPAFNSPAENVFDKVPDLAGVRLLHLHMRQMEKIHPLLMKIIADEGYVLSGGPAAKTWDLEYEQMFKKLKVYKGSEHPHAAQQPQRYGAKSPTPSTTRTRPIRSRARSN